MLPGPPKFGSKRTRVAYSAIHQATRLCAGSRNALQSVLPFTANGHFSIMHGMASDHGASSFVDNAVSVNLCHKQNTTKNISIFYFFMSSKVLVFLLINCNNFKINKIINRI